VLDAKPAPVGMSGAMRIHAGNTGRSDPGLA
jgi:hypothetical protein